MIAKNHRAQYNKKTQKGRRKHCEKCTAITLIIGFIYDGLDIVQELQNGSATANYIRTLGIDEPLARIKADGSLRYYQTDAQHSAIALTDKTGAIATKYTYDPFGGVVATGETSNTFQYTGGENDGTWLYYYRAKYYDPRIQRILNHLLIIS